MLGGANAGTETVDRENLEFVSFLSAPASDSHWIEISDHEDSFG